jgi:serine/threonine protein kinase
MQTNSKNNRRSYLIKIVRLCLKLRKSADRDKAMYFEQICNQFVSLGGIYVKFLQGVMLELPMLKAWSVKANYSVYEDLPFEPIDLEAILKQDLGPNLAYLHNIEREPFAAGSFGQVYRAKHSNGRKIIIKVLRPTSGNMMRDIKTISRLSYWFRGALTSWDVDVRSLTNQFLRTTKAETDYRSEVAFALRIATICKDDPVFVIPKTYAQLCSPRVIVQDFLEGVSCAKLLKLQIEQGVDPAEYVKQQTGSDLASMLEAMILQINVLGHSGKNFHGDMHPGNIRFMPGNKIGLIDFGIAAQVDPNRIDAFYLLARQYWKCEGAMEPDVGQLFSSIMRYYSPKVFHSLRLVSDHQNGGDFLAKLSKVINDYILPKIPAGLIEDSVKNVRLGTVLSAYVNQNNRFGLKASVDDISWNRNWYTMAAMITSLGFRANFQRVYKKLNDEAELIFPDRLNEEKVTMDIGDAYQNVSDWLSEVAQNDLYLFRALKSQLNL